MQKIGQWIANAYYWFLYWVAGEKDVDENPNTVWDRDKWTYKMRRQKRRWGYAWWVVAPLPWLAVTVWTCMIFPSWWNFLSIPMLALAWWLFAHVCYSDDIGF